MPIEHPTEPPKNEESLLALVDATPTDTGGSSSLALEDKTPSSKGKGKGKGKNSLALEDKPSRFKRSLALPDGSEPPAPKDLEERVSALKKDACSLM